MFQNKNLLVGIIVILMIGIFGGAWFVLGKHASSSQQTVQNTNQSDQSGQTQNVGSMQPSDIGLQIVLTPDQKKVSFSANKLAGVKSLEWNFSYQANIPVDEQTSDNAGQKVTQEFGSDQPVLLNGQTSYTSTPRELGTCSSGHCRYDTGITTIQLEVKVTKNNGSVFQIEDSAPVLQ